MEIKKRRYLHVINEKNVYIYINTFRRDMHNKGLLKKKCLIKQQGLYIRFHVIMFCERSQSNWITIFTIFTKYY